MFEAGNHFPSNNSEGMFVPVNGTFEAFASFNSLVLIKKCLSVVAPMTGIKYLLNRTSGGNEPRQKCGSGADPRPPERDTNNTNPRRALNQKGAVKAGVTNPRSCSSFRGRGGRTDRWCPGHGELEPRHDQPLRYVGTASCHRVHACVADRQMTEQRKRFARAPEYRTSCVILRVTRAKIRQLRSAKVP